MKMKLSSLDVLQIAKALKCGWLDTDRIESFKSLVDGYNPPKEISRKELSYYLDCLYKGWGYEPTEGFYRSGCYKGFGWHVHRQRARL